jgi:hypothetical protein
LPCISFRPAGPRSPPKKLAAHKGEKAGSEDQEEQQMQEQKPLYITVTLMTDDEPRKRCFHCVFTDSPGTNGALGSVTPELLSSLFTQQHMITLSSESSNGKRKRCPRAMAKSSPTDI